MLEVLVSCTLFIVTKIQYAISWSGAVLVNPIGTVSTLPRLVVFKVSFLLAQCDVLKNQTLQFQLRSIFFSSVSWLKCPNVSSHISGIAVCNICNRDVILCSESISDNGPERISSSLGCLPLEHVGRVHRRWAV